MELTFTVAEYVHDAASVVSHESGFPITELIGTGGSRPLSAARQLVVWFTHRRMQRDARFGGQPMARLDAAIGDVLGWSPDRVAYARRVGDQRYLAEEASLMRYLSAYLVGMGADGQVTR